MENIYTKGNVLVNEIKVGDIHYEFEYGFGMESKVLTLPVRDKKGIWRWKSENVRTNEVIDYSVNEKNSAYSVNLYDHKAYSGVKWL